ncbi:MAG: GIY-YIG nuclease family protein [Stygiobacter sp.]
MKYFVYILESNLKRHYIGYTSNLDQRIKQHNSKHKGFTGTSEKWEIIIYLELEKKDDAIKLESKLKSFKNYRKAIEYIEKLKGTVG